MSGTVRKESGSQWLKYTQACAAEEKEAQTVKTFENVLKPTFCYLAA